MAVHPFFFLTMTRARLLAVAILCGILAGALPMPASAQATPFAGVWVLSPGRSTYRTPPPYTRITLSIVEADERVSVTYDMVRVRGGVMHLEWVGRFDGRDYPLEGLEDFTVTNAYRRVDARTLEVIQRVEGQVSVTATMAVSENGRELTVVTPSRDASGRDTTTTTVYTRRR